MADYATLDRQMIGRTAERRKLANNTYAERRPNGDIAVRLHGTDVVTCHPDGSATLTTGGWYTVTTKDRINAYAPGGWRLSSNRGRWQLLRGPWDAAETIPFVDGMTIEANGDIRGRSAIEAAETLAAAERRKLDRSISRYVAEYVAELSAGNLPTPNGGDCWACLFADKDGHAVMGSDHLLSHITDRSYVPSLAVLALRDAGMSDTGVVIRLGMRTDETGEHMGGRVQSHYSDVGRILRRYMRRQLIPGAGGARPSDAGTVNRGEYFGR